MLPKFPFMIQRDSGAEGLLHFALTKRRPLSADCPERSRKPGIANRPPPTPSRLFLTMASGRVPFVSNCVHGRTAVSRIISDRRSKSDSGGRPDIPEQPVKNICLIGFRSTESRRVVSSLKLNALDADFVDIDGDLSTVEKLGEAVALVWCGDGDVSAPHQQVYRAVETGAPVVALLPAMDLYGVDPAAGNFEVCFPPFNGAELMVRMQVAESRAGFGAESNLISRGELTIDCDRYEVSVSGGKINLTYKEFKLLEYLASNPGRVFTREALLRSVWGYDYFGGTRTVDVHVRRLRSKIDSAPNRFIETVWNVGYRFRAAETATT